MKLFADIVFAWLIINGALFALMPREQALRLSRNTINRFKRAVGGR